MNGLVLNAAKKNTSTQMANAGAVGVDKVGARCEHRPVMGFLPSKGHSLA